MRPAAPHVRAFAPVVVMAIATTCSHVPPVCPPSSRSPPSVSESLTPPDEDLRPRCAASDPTCGPVPYNAACPEQAGYDPKRPRKIIRSRNAQGECTHDGDCYVRGCGNQCVPASLTRLGDNCRGRDWPNVLCGCVNTACAWFTTTER